MPSTSSILSPRFDADPVSPRVAAGVISVADAGSPVAGVLVSDGHNLVRTDQAGRYELPLAKAARWVQVINPPGYRPDASLYRLLAGEKSSRMQADFVLQVVEQAVETPFTFVHLSDSHLANVYRGERMRVDYVDAINRMPRRPAFVLDTGDLCINAPEQLEIAAGVSRAYCMPYMATIGNHDRFRLETFERLLRPSYHAFTFGKYLILSLPWREEMDAAYAWTRQLLGEMGDAFDHLLVSVHHAEAMGKLFDDFAALFRQHLVRGMFVGHYHINQISEYAGIPTYMIRGAVARNNDMGRPVFNLIEAHPDGQLRLEQREVGRRQVVSLLTPDDCGVLDRNSRQSLWVRACDTSVRVRRIVARLHAADAGGVALATVALQQRNAELWSADLIPDDTWPGEVYVQIEVEDETGQRWEPIHVLRQVALKTPSIQLYCEKGGTGKKGVALRQVHGLPGRLGFSRPVWQGGVLYVGVEHVTQASLKNPVLMAINATTGRCLWQYEDRGRCVRTTPLVTDRLVVVQADDGRVIAVDRVNGRLRWIHDSLRSGGATQQLYFRSSPVAVGTEDVLVGGGQFYSRLSLEDGRARWCPDGIPGRRGSAAPSPVVVGDRIVTVQGRSLRVLRSDDGRMCWERTFQSIHTQPAVVGANVYVVLSGCKEAATPWSRERWAMHATAIDLNSGRTRWTTPMQHCGSSYCSPCVVDRTMMVVDYDELVGLDIGTGREEWRSSFAHALSPQAYLMSTEMASAALYTNARDGLVVGDPAVEGDVVYLVSRMGTVMAFDLRERCWRWSYPLNTTVVSGPTVADGAIYVAGSDGGLYVLMDQA